MSGPRPGAVCAARVLRGVALDGLQQVALVAAPRHAQGDPRSAQHRQPLGQFVGVLRQFGDGTSRAPTPRLPAGRHGHRRVLVGQCAVELGENCSTCVPRESSSGRSTTQPPLSADAPVAHLEDLDRRPVRRRPSRRRRRRCRRRGTTACFSMARRSVVASSRKAGPPSRSRGPAPPPACGTHVGDHLVGCGRRSRRNRRRSGDARRH